MSNSKAAAKRTATRHRQIMFRLLASESTDVICAEMKITPSNLQTIIESPLFKSELVRVHKRLREKLLAKGNLSVQQRLKNLNTKAIDTLEAIIQNDKIPLPLRRVVAKDVIDYNLKIEEQNTKDSVSPQAAFFQEAFNRSQLREAKKKEEAKKAALLTQRDQKKLAAG